MDNDKIQALFQGRVVLAYMKDDDPAKAQFRSNLGKLEEEYVKARFECPIEECKCTEDNEAIAILSDAINESLKAFLEQAEAEDKDRATRIVQLRKSALKHVVSRLYATSALAAMQQPKENQQSKENILSC